RNGRYFVRRHRAVVSVLGATAAVSIAWILLRPVPPWSGDVRVIRLNARTQKVERYPDFTSVSPGDKLGIDVLGDKPAYVYALSVFGSHGPREWVMPVGALVAKGTAESAPDVWGVCATPGARLTYVSVSPDPTAGQQEGLIVFASSKPQPWLARWMDRMNAQ